MVILLLSITKDVFCHNPPSLFFSPLLPPPPPLPDSASDDNLLKNIELFDKLCLRFHGRILFIKDVIGSQEICCWSFYGHKNKVAEVCCTSIVYATERKQTKVLNFFPRVVQAIR